MSQSGYARVLFMVFVIQGLMIVHTLGKKHSRKNNENETTFDKNSKPGQYTCPCGKSFKTKPSLEQHMSATGHDRKYNINAKEDIKSKPGQYTCPCGKSFKTQASLEQHMSATGHDREHNINAKEGMKYSSGQYTCTCGKFFKTQASLEQHMSATGHDRKYSKKAEENVVMEETHQKTVPKRPKLQRSNSVDRDEKVDSTKARRRSIDETEKEKIAIDKHERSNAIDEYSYHVKKIVKHINTQEKGKIYSAEFRKAGSYSVKTKVGKANEFDTNIVLKIDVKDVFTNVTLAYIYDDKKAFDDKRSLPRQMEGTRKFRDIEELRIPHGQAVVKVKNPSVIRHLTYEMDLIPHKVLQDLYTKVKTAIRDLKMTNVELSPTATGPALTITLKQEKYNDINVDLVPSLPCSLPVTINGWPRKETRRAFSKKIDAIKEAGLHLVPKGDETWAISYSKAERALLDGIDDQNECRREVMKLMKQYLETCKEKSSNGLPGLSSHIVKIQILWSSENRRAPGYWSQKYKDRCLLDTIQDMVISLESGELAEYFDDEINILARKDKSELRYFANCLRKEKSDLENVDETNRIKDEL